MNDDDDFPSLGGGAAASSVSSGWGRPSGGSVPAGRGAGSAQSQRSYYDEYPGAMPSMGMGMMYTNRFTNIINLYHFFLPCAVFLLFVAGRGNRR